MKINLNADMGEGFGAYRIGHDNLLLKVVTSANVASGFHAGDPWVMTETLAMAKAEGVSVGAHPSYPDLQGFGRRVMHIQPDELKAITLYQIGALDGIARAAGLHVTHTKPHGALNNMACENADIARAIAEAVRAYDPEMILLAPVFSELAKAGQEAGLPVALEVFADRAYTDAGHLLSRRQAGAVLHNPEDCVANVRRMVERGGVVSINDQFLPTPFHSVCVHGDNELAADNAAQVRRCLEELGCTVATLPGMRDQLG
jgi:UPF0271 protein